jgi:hypothetical protein
MYARIYTVSRVAKVLPHTDCGVGKRMRCGGNIYRSRQAMIVMQPMFTGEKHDLNKDYTEDM